MSQGGGGNMRCYTGQGQHGRTRFGRPDNVRGADAIRNLD